ncbi:MAG: hypothetical protein CMD46_05365 [Gammaproteobacteria bacterium]|nr:hypothetical protein [Gammaproteobacteria bacterium]
MSPIVTISGGGIIGNYISLRLNKSNIESIIIEKSKKNDSKTENIRTLTLNPFSKKLLDDIGIEVPYASIKDINVLDGDGSGKINFSSKEINEDALSYVVFFNDLQDRLQNKNKILFENQIEEITQDNKNNYSEVILTNKNKIKTKFIAGCDGRKSNVAKLVSLNEKKSSYNQTAITFTSKCEVKDKYLAHQIFSEKGIFAIMPIPLSNNDSTHTIVWSVDNQKLEDADIKDFVASNISYFEQKLSTKIDIDSSILSFKLFKHYFESYISDSVVLVGDAAHSIHPLAGQGINLGFADADVLCEEIISSYEKSRNIDQAITLKRYEIRRKNINLIMLKSMDFFVNLFGSKNLYVKLLRNLGLSGVNKTQFLKKFFINHAAGKNKL